MAPDDVSMGRRGEGEVPLLHLHLHLLLLVMVRTGEGFEVMRRQVLLLMVYWHWYTLQTHRCAQVLHHYSRINSCSI
jgi:hypothetical protein